MPSLYLTFHDDSTILNDFLHKFFGLHFLKIIFQFLAVPTLFQQLVRIFRDFFFFAFLSAAVSVWLFEISASKMADCVICFRFSTEE